MIQPDSPQIKATQGKFDGWIRLQRHADAQAIEVNACDPGSLGVKLSFFFDDGGENEGLARG
jgi:hypothetical protein